MKGQEERGGGAGREEGVVNSVGEEVEMEGGRSMSDIILEWNLDKKLFSTVVDNASSNDSMKSPSAYQKFENAINQCKLKNRRKVAMDVPTRWNSTFLLLDFALPLKEAFGRLEQIDRNYKLNPSEDEWKVAYIVHDCLKKIYDAANHFSGNSFSTSNVFFPDICKLQLKLKEWENSDHDFIRNMASPMKEKFEKYWDECCLVLAIAVVFDPRFKLALVEYNYNVIYGQNAKQYVDRIRSAIVDLFVEYGGELNPSFGYACGSDVEESNFTGANKESDDISDELADEDMGGSSSKFQKLG
ncbi:hypothetical protein ACH5RR_006992 [Cinchona calisaya]|uniref:hAT-like transposase RNase-H fold domain-containing protein n=1 Tax=Cinchona calisaya TaxID=153742 RepID=A0ABD3AQL6_9GENT